MSSRTSGSSLPPAPSAVRRVPTKPGAAARKSQNFNDTRTARKASQTTQRSSGASTSNPGEVVQANLVAANVADLALRRKHGQPGSPQDERVDTAASTCSCTFQEAR